MGFKNAVLPPKKESKRLAINAAYQKAVNALADVSNVGFSELTEMEREVIAVVSVSLLRKIKED